MALRLDRTSDARPEFQGDRPDLLKKGVFKFNYGTIEPAGNVNRRRRTPIGGPAKTLRPFFGCNDSDGFGH